MCSLLGTIHLICKIHLWILFLNFILSDLLDRINAVTAFDSMFCVIYTLDSNDFRLFLFMFIIVAVNIVKLGYFVLQLYTGNGVWRVGIRSSSRTF